VLLAWNFKDEIKHYLLETFSYRGKYLAHCPSRHTGRLRLDVMVEGVMLIFPFLTYGYTRNSVVVPAYNEAEHLEDIIRTMEKAFDEEKFNYEICIVNNGSTDKTGEIIAKLEKEIYASSRSRSKITSGMVGASRGSLKGSW